MPRVPRIPSPIVDQLEPPIVNTPQFEPPIVNGLRPPVVDVPSVEMPTYEPPEYLGEPEIQTPGPINQEEEQAEEGIDARDLPESEDRQIIEVPIVGEVPLPRSSEIALAGTTAVAATAAAIFGKSLVEWLVSAMKPVFKKIMLKIAMSRRQLTETEEQLYFELEGRVAKRLKADAQADRQKQLEARLQRQRQHKR